MDGNQPLQYHRNRRLSSFHLLKNVVLFFPCWFLNGICHYWTFIHIIHIYIYIYICIFQGLKQSLGFSWLNLPKKLRERRYQALRPGGHWSQLHDPAGLVSELRRDAPKLFVRGGRGSGAGRFLRDLRQLLGLQFQVCGS